MIDDPLLEQLLRPLHGRFAAARAAYRAYLDEGRTFLHATSLRRINEAARSLLLDQGRLLPEALRPDAAALVAHYDVWLASWDELAERERPAPGDRFAFETKMGYPRDAEQRLERLYERLGGAPR